MTAARPARTRPAGGRPPGPDPTRLAGLLARTWLEIRAGRRPLGQLEPLLAPAVRRRLLLQLRTRPRGEPIGVGRISRVTATRPTTEACEATVLVEYDGRTTAFAVRLEQHRGTWRVVELTPPEAGLPPLSTASLHEVIGDDPGDDLDAPDHER